jgi:hypothetical protein
MTGKSAKYDGLIYHTAVSLFRRLPYKIIVSTGLDFFFNFIDGTNVASKEMKYKSLTVKVSPEKREEFQQAILSLQKHRKGWK